MVKPTVISTFCGTGGSSLGYKWAGYKELLAVDYDPHAVQCFKLNFPEVPVWHRSITDIKGQEILDFCKIKPGELDLFDGSPPCQGFSTAGKRKVNDPRNDLFIHYARLIIELKPKVFVMENVTGMAKGKMKGRFLEILKILNDLPYQVKAKQMNSMYYGVPQSRERIIFVGVREDLGKTPVFPSPNKKILAAKEFISKDVIRIGNGQFKTKTHPRLGASIISTDKPSQTITKTRSMVFETPNGYRHPTINEAKRLCSFPDEWRLVGTEIAQWARLGNAVMPKFMEAIAKTIKEEIFNGNG